MICRNIKILFTMPVYIFSALSISTLLFISTIITFWVSDYLKNVMKIDEDTIFLLFVITCVTAPATGIVGGGIIVQKSGGYESKHSILFCFVFGFCAGLLSILTLTPVTESILGFGITLWLFLFFGGAMVPNMIGILLDSLPTKSLKGAGNSFNLIVSATLGYLPGPYMYSLIMKAFKDTNPRLPFSLCLLYSWVGVLFVSIAMIYRYKKFEEIRLKNKQNIEIEEEIEMQMQEEEEKNEIDSEENNDSKGNDNDNKGNDFVRNLFNFSFKEI